MAFEERRAAHTRVNESNNIDPDDGNSWLCSACNLPIFSTPFIKSYQEDDEGGDDDDGSSKVIIFLHDQCANLPQKLKDSTLHPKEPLFLVKMTTSSSTTESCYKCNKRCRTMLYRCTDCNITLDVLCALTSTTPIRILHRSHEHRLMAVRGAGLKSFLVCGACGERHPDQALSLSLSADVSYLCGVCCFWIHPDCATLPNIIIQLQHSKNQHYHPLVLNYYGSRPDSSTPRNEDESTRNCAICERPITSAGDYSCISCPDYHVHIRCAVSDPHSFNPVLTREAQLPDMVSLPVPDEYTSLVRYLTDRIGSTTTTSSSSDPHDDDDGLRQLHEHPLILHHDHEDNNDDDDNNNDRRPVCNACAQIIISTPFYRCSDCPDFFLHNCCAHLPPTLTQHPAHKHHSLSLRPRDAGKSFLSNYYCNSCWRQCDGFSYHCAPCNFDVDLFCAFMPASITHHAHAESTHILFSSYIYSHSIYQQIRYNCCSRSLRRELRYECGTCHNFLIHAKCALLPDTVRHRLDQHPLQLITTPSCKYGSDGQEQQPFCEICEREIDNTIWYYSCDKCDQSFHTDCIPCFDYLSGIKFGVTSIHVRCHECHLTLIRGLEIRGCRCGYCGETFDSWDSLAFECSKCYFRIHQYCAAQCMQES